ncbi:uncharacterized protein LOC113790114 isoform X2 [Dermatophagoides pteronyssinus]|uniref:uncharacterized protein LOC113790114 isoform X2 n=1 Tax=Dermatophagoides pteronyssinus TaxID=6956 RepID=UPI003F670B14
MRVSTFICVTTSLFIGAVILISNCGSNWHVAKGSIAGPYRAFSKEKIYANVGVYIGLDSVNITMKALPIHRHHEEINYNERFYWIGANQMKHEFQRALAKGLPFPILTISEYLSQDGEGFNWGRHYRLAGYYTSISLWLAFASWILMNILLCAVPRYGAYTMQLTGLLMLLSNLLYIMMIPGKPLRIPFEGSTLIFSYGWCFWLVFAAGLTAVFIGATVSIVDILFPNKFSTILEVDYDTPYRYFVGNDIHIVGSLPPPLNAYYYHHQHQSSLSTTISSNQSNQSSHHLYQKKNKLSSNNHNNILRHYSASKTASLTTNTSSCCAGSTTRLTSSSTTTTTNHHHHQSIAKTKSDASTCTRDDDDLLMMIMANNDKKKDNETITSCNNRIECIVDVNDDGCADLKKHQQQIFTTKAEIETNSNSENNNDDNNNNTIIVSNYSKDSVQRINQLNQDVIDDDDDKQFAFENRAYHIDDDDDDDHRFKEKNLNQGEETKEFLLNKDKQPEVKSSSNELLLLSSTPTPSTSLMMIKSSSSISSPSPSLSSSSPISTDIDDDDDVEDDAANESDVSTTIIDGKRAISLSNFGKFTEQYEKRENFFNHNPHNNNSHHSTTFGYPLASAGFRAIKSGFINRQQRNKSSTATTTTNETTSKSMKIKRLKSSTLSSSLDKDDTNGNGHPKSSTTTTTTATTVRVDLSSSAAMW